MVSGRCVTATLITMMARTLNSQWVPLYRSMEEMLGTPYLLIWER